VSFAAKTLCVASQRVFIVVGVYFVIDSVQKLLYTPSYRPKFSFAIYNDVYICKIIFSVFLCLCNYYIILYYKSPPAWGLGEGLTTPHRKSQPVTKCYTEPENGENVLEIMFVRWMDG
jgi:hypothetical protein